MNGYLHVVHQQHHYNAVYASQNNAVDDTRLSPGKLYDTKIQL